MKLLTTKNVYFNHKKCYKCGKRIMLTQYKHGILCDECTEKAKKTRTLTKFPKDYSSRKYIRLKKELIKLAGCCALCGSKKSLTAHHIGGQENIGLTCLCDECHKTYELWNIAKKRAKKKEKVFTEADKFKKGDK